MKRLILVVSAFLLFAALVSGQHKSPSPHKEGGGSSHPVPKPLPSLGGGTLAPREPRSPKHSTPNLTITPEMEAQLNALGKGTAQPRKQPPHKQPTPNLTITPDIVSPWRGSAKVQQLPKVRALVSPTTPQPKKRFPVVTMPAPRTPQHSNQKFTSLPEVKGQLGALSNSKQGALAPRALPPATSEPLNPTAQAASANAARANCIELRNRDKSIRCVTEPFAYLRSDPNSFFVNTVHHYDPFRVLAVRHQPTKKGGDSCYYYGDSIGRVQLKHVWIDCRSLDDMPYHPDPPAAAKPEYHQAGTKNIPKSVVTTRDYLDTRFSDHLFKENRNGDNGAKIALPRKPKNKTNDEWARDKRKDQIEIFANFDPKKANDPKTHGLYDSLGFIDVTDPHVKFNGRYIANGGNVVVLDYRHPGKNGKEVGRWVFADRNKVHFVKPPEKKKK